MARFLTVRGKPGALVPNPHALGTNPPRFCGKERNSAPADAHPHERYSDKPEVLRDEQFIRDAVRRGYLIPLDADTARLCGVPFEPPAKGV